MISARREGEVFGQQLKAMRLKRGLSQQTVAERCGSNYPYISELERGLKVPTLTMILRLASALECRVRDLVGVFDTASPDSFLGQ
jgi:transcriptional regulator with XRE-family HTH domain